ncbi:MAG: YeeE/YedE family protein [Burkholderiales bacterium]|nr:YeeE/YedE family protein [Burkholderiales bacterium]OJX07907.1 MAG: YeeE/YedE [Burkholderiales bacterium 70-64]
MPVRSAIAAAFVALAWFVSLRQGVLFLVGVGMGVALAAARFGFTTGWRRFVVDRDARGMLAQIVLLALAAALSMPLLARFPTELIAALGPPSVSLLVGAFVFGLAMQIADGCGSGTLYKAGMGVPLNVAALPLFAVGSFLGAAHLHFWLSLGRLEPFGLVQAEGPGKALALTLAALAIVAALVAWRGRGAGLPRLDRRLLVGALALAVLAALNLVIAGQPWGVVYGFGLWAAKLAVAAGWDPSGNAFWGQPAQLAQLSQTILLDVTSITNIGILAGALAVAERRRRAGDEGPAPRLTRAQWSAGLLAGLAMGYSSRLAFGCNVGAFVSGISTGSLHGWIWWALAFAGTLVGVRLRTRLGFQG